LWPFFIGFVDKRAGTVAEISTLWIKNLQIPYWIGGNAMKPVEKVAFSPVGIREGARGKDHSACE
jgi:hypothetical protein